MPDLEQDTRFMHLAIDASQQALNLGNTPFGAALVREGVLLHVSGNNQVTASDCTGHAEVVLLREAASKHGREALRGTTVYASGEPCAMCSGAIFWAGAVRIVFAATTQDIERALGGSSLPIRCAAVLATATPRVMVEGPLLQAEAIAVLRRMRA
jgi:tRNA(adenine34) deaminase